MIIVSLFGSAILERLRVDSPASDPRNPFYRVFDGSVGEWLDNFDVDRFHEELFVQEAGGDWLDVHGEVYGVKRRIDESDEDFRERIVKHTKGELTPQLLAVDFGLTVLVYVEDFSVDGLTLTSDNRYINSCGWIVICDEETRRLVESGFVLNEVVSWFVV